MKEISVFDFAENPFKTISKDWLLITARKDNRVNTMTASWGGMGFIWNKPVAYIFIRPQRYTKEFIDAGSELSLSVLPDSFRKELSYFGRVSGRDEDKIATSGLELEYSGDVPYFKDSDTAMICRKLFAQPFTESSFVDRGIIEKCYPDKDFHTMYVVEIEKLLVK